MSSRRGTEINRMVSLFAIAIAVLVASTQGQQPEDCRLYQVTEEKSSPILENSNDFFEIHLSLGLLFENSSATITLSTEGSDQLSNEGTTLPWNIDQLSEEGTILPGNIDGDPSNACQLTVNKENKTLEGTCFEKRDALLLSQDEGWDTLLLRRNGPMLVAFIDNKSNILKFTPSSKVKIQVTSDTIVNMAFNCPSHCFQFNNGIILSMDSVFGPSAVQTGIGNDENSTGVIKVLFGEDLSENRPFKFNETIAFDTGDYQDGGHEDGSGLWKQFNVLSQHDDNNTLSVSGSLVGSDNTVLIGPVPSLDTYFKFENMDNILWNTCPLGEDFTTEFVPDIDNETTSSSYVDLEQNTTEENITASDDNFTDDFGVETDEGVQNKTTDKSTTVSPKDSTTTRFKEDIDCKDTKLPKCTLTQDHNASCDCTEAKANGWCDDLDSYPDIKENCKKSCGLCTDQDGVISDGPQVPETTSDIEGRSKGGKSESSVGTTKPPKRASANDFVYVMIGIVVVMFVVLVIFLIYKKRKAAGHMDLESQSQSMLLKDSNEKANGNNKDTGKNDKQESADNIAGVRNNDVKEQDEVNETTKLNDEKANADDRNREATENSSSKDNDSPAKEENSPSSDEKDNKNTDESSTEKDQEDKVDDDDNKKDDNKNTDEISTEKDKEDKTDDDAGKKDDKNNDKA